MVLHRGNLSKTMELKLVLWVLMLFSPFLVSCETKIAYLEKSKVDPRRGTLVTESIFQKRTQILASNLSIGQDKPFLASHGPSGTFCWIGRLEPGHYLEIHCFQAKSNKTQILVLPRLVPSRAPLADPNTFLDFDALGENIYWRDPVSAAVWVTSLSTRASRIVRQVCGANYQTHGSRMFKVDSKNKVIFCEITLPPEEDETAYVARILQAYEIRPSNEPEDTRQRFLYNSEDFGFATGTAIDPDNGLAYIIKGTAGRNPNQLVAIRYCKDPNCEHLEVAKPEVIVKEAFAHERPYLHLAEGNLIWRLVNGSYVRYNLNDGNASLRLLEFTATDFTVFEDSVQFEKVDQDSCRIRNCSHICVATRWRAECLCPSFATLIHGTDCVENKLLLFVNQEPLIFTHMNNQVNNVSSFSHCNSANSRESLNTQNSSHICSRLNSSNSSGKSLLDMTPFSSEQEISRSFAQFDPLWTGFFYRERGWDKCIRWYSMRFQNVTDIHCAPRSRAISQFVIDPINSLIFWTEIPDEQFVYVESSQGFLIIGKDLFSQKEVLRLPQIGDSLQSVAVSGLTCDGVKKRLYWLTLESLSSCNYDGSSPAVLSRGERFASESNIQLVGDQLYWILEYANRTPESLISFDLSTASKTVVYKSAPEDAINFYALPHLEVNSLMNDSICSDCSFSCITLAGGDYRCACPEFSQMGIFGETKCSSIKAYALLWQTDGTVSMSERVDLQQLNETFDLTNTTVEKVSEKWQTAQKRTNASDFVFASRRVSDEVNDVCWVDKKTGAIECADPVIKKTSSIGKSNKDSTLLAFSRAGDEVYFNDGSLGNVTMWSFKLDLGFEFPHFETDDSGRVALDTEKSILFWSSNRGFLRYKILHDSKSEIGSVQVSEADEIQQIAVDSFKSIVYIATDNQLLKMTYRDMFSSSSMKSTLLADIGIHEKGVYTPESVQHLQVYQDYLFWTSSVSPFVAYNLQNGLVIRKESADKVLAWLFLEPSNTMSLASASIDPCSKARCSHFCFRQTSISQELSITHKCECPKGMRLVDDYTCVSPPDRSSIIAGTSTAALVAILVITMLVIALIRNRRRNNELARVIQEIKYGNVRAANSATNDAEKAQHLPLTCIVDPEDLAVNEAKILGDGAFGMVLQGVYKNMVVAVKTLKPSSSPTQLADFAKEVKIMNYIGHHPHIVQCLGVDISNLKRGYFYAILEFSPIGSLINHLRKLQPEKQQIVDFGPIIEQRYANQASAMTGYINHSLELEQPLEKTSYSNQLLEETDTNLLIDWAEQVAMGMAYLAEKSVIHGDLAARNVLIFDNNVLKISDFGLSKQLYSDVNYKKKTNTPLPWRWMAIESLKYMTFSVKSDVWSYGITVWEIFTFGKFPFPQESWNEDFMRLIEEGTLRLNQPDGCPESVYSALMASCWDTNPDNRPSFHDIVLTCKQLKEIMTGYNTRNVYVNQPS